MPEILLRTTQRCLLVLLALAWPGVAPAERPVGQHALQIAAPYEIYRIAGASVDPAGVLPGVDCSSRSPGATGKLIFNCALPYPGAVPDDTLDGKITFLPSNTIEAGVGTSHIAVKASFAGVVKAGGERIEITFTLKGRGDVDPVLGEADVPLRLKQCVSVAGEKVCQSMSFGSTRVPMKSTDGTWTLDLYIVHLGGKNLGGTASATFPGPIPTVLGYDIEGIYDRSEGVSTLKLVPQNKKRGNLIALKNFEVVGGQITGGKLLYTVWRHIGRIPLRRLP
jgi:hypothetical protein